VKEYLLGWLAGSKPSLRPSSYATYETLLRLHVIPFVGRHRLARLSPQHLQNLYSDRLTAGGLSPASVRKIHAVLHRALEQARKWRLIVQNPAADVTLPRLERREMSTLNREQAKLLLEAASGDRLEALYILAITTGMREGELLGLQWGDVDPDAGSVHVQRTLYRGPEGFVLGEPKTRGSRRQVLLGPLALEGLRRHRVNQAAERLLCGSSWQDIGLIFPNELGRPMEASNLRRRSFEPLLARAGLPHIRFHDLRHSAATLLLGQNVHPKVVSECLGHSQVSITLDLYSHVTPTMQRQAADAMESMLRA
jgi:integrase